MSGRGNPFSNEVFVRCSGMSMKESDVRRIFGGFGFIRFVGMAENGTSALITFDNEESAHQAIANPPFGMSVYPSRRSQGFESNTNQRNVSRQLSTLNLNVSQSNNEQQIAPGFMATGPLDVLSALPQFNFHFNMAQPVKPNTKLCAFCGAALISGYRCSVCHTPYCNEACRTNDWPSHMKECRAPPPLEPDVGLPMSRFSTLRRPIESPAPLKPATRLAMGLASSKSDESELVPSPETRVENPPKVENCGLLVASPPRPNIIWDGPNLDTLNTSTQYTIKRPDSATGDNPKLPQQLHSELDVFKEGDTFKFRPCKSGSSPHFTGVLYEELTLSRVAQKMQEFCREVAKTGKFLDPAKIIEGSFVIVFDKGGNYHFKRAFVSKVQGSKVEVLLTDHADSMELPRKPELFLDHVPQMDKYKSCGLFFEEIKSGHVILDDSLPTAKIVKKVESDDRTNFVEVVVMTEDSKPAGNFRVHPWYKMDLKSSAMFLPSVPFQRLPTSYTTSTPIKPNHVASGNQRESPKDVKEPTKIVETKPVKNEVVASESSAQNRRKSPENIKRNLSYENAKPVDAKPTETAAKPVETASQTNAKPVETAPPKPVETAPPKPVETAPPKPVETAPPKSSLTVSKPEVHVEVPKPVAKQTIAVQPEAPKVINPTLSDIPKMSFAVGDKLLILDFDETLNKVIVQKISQLDDMEKVFNLLADGPKTPIVGVPEVNQIYSCKWESKDGDGQYYRAVVKDVKQSIKKVKVEFVDFLNKSIENFSNLSPLPKALSGPDYPCLASVISLNNVPDTRVESDGIQSLVNELKMTFAESPVTVTKIEEKNGTKLFTVEIEEGFALNDVLKDLDTVVVPVQPKAIESAKFSAKEALVKLGLTVGHEIQVTKVETSSPAEIFVIRECDADKIGNVVELISQLGPGETFEPQVGEACLARASDNDWYRGVAQSKVDNGFKIFFPDFGFEETVIKTKIVKIPANVAQVDYPVFKVVLNEFSHSKLSDDDIALWRNLDLLELKIKLLKLTPDESGFVVSVLNFTPSQQQAVQRIKDSCIRAHFNAEEALSKIGLTLGQEVEVSKVESPNPFEIYMVRCNDTQKIEQVLEGISQLETRQICEPKEGEIVLAQASDNDWYRGVAKTKFDAGFEIFFPDFGFEETVAKAKIAKCPVELARLDFPVFRGVLEDFNGLQLAKDEVDLWKSMDLESFKLKVQKLTPDESGVVISILNWTSQQQQIIQKIKESLNKKGTPAFANQMSRSSRLAKFTSRS